MVEDFFPEIIIFVSMLLSLDMECRRKLASCDRHYCSKNICKISLSLKNKVFWKTQIQQTDNKSKIRKNMLNRTRLETVIRSPKV